jgi:hypothetical protein
MKENVEREQQETRPPTPDEEAAAERAAEDVDVDEVRSHNEEMRHIGANVRGEGAIESEQ